MKKYFIKEHRQAAGLTQSELAKRIGCDQAMVARWENIERDDETIITDESLSKIAKALKVSVKDIDSSFSSDTATLIHQAKEDAYEISSYFSENKKTDDLKNLVSQLSDNLEKHNRDEVLINILQISHTAQHECEFYYELLSEKKVSSKFISIVAAFDTALLHNFA